MLKKNYKIFIGLGIGLGLAFIFAMIFKPTHSTDGIIGAADELYYDSSNNWIKSTNVQGALDEIYAVKDGCPVGNACLPKKIGNMSVLDVGDYISYTPSLSSATALGTMTGYNASGTPTNINGTGITYTPSNQSFQPNELTLWRVYRKIEGVGVEIIPEYVSTQTIYFKSEKGYKNLVGYLNELASKYENSSYTVTGYSRHFGSDWNTGYCKTHNDWSTCGQTQYITSLCNGNQSNCTISLSEPLGGGDDKYLQDYSYIRGETYNGVSGTTAFGSSAKAYNKNGTASSYWMANRYYSFSSATRYTFYGRYVSTYGGGRNSSNNLYYYSSSKFYIGSNCVYALRPIVTLDSSLEYAGLGSKDSPLIITNTKS